MGVIKWTGKAFQFAGRILTADEVEQWLENEGKRLLEERVSNMSKKWLFGKARAKKSIKREALEVTNSSQAFKNSLNNVLNSLPKIISSIGDNLKIGAPEVLYEENNSDWVLAIPRSFVRSKFKDIVIAELANSAELSDYPGLATSLLRDASENAEDAFFNKISQENDFICDPEGYVLVGADRNYKWSKSELSGHYYLALDYFGLPDMTVKAGIKKFHTAFDPLVSSLSIKIGKMDQATLTGALVHIDQC